MRRFILLPALLAVMFATAAAAQALLDIGSLREIDNAEILTVDGREVGEVEDVLVDATGRPVAIVVEIDGDFLALDDDDVVFALDQLTYENGGYVTSLSMEAIEALPRHDD